MPDAMHWEDRIVQTELGGRILNDALPEPIQRLAAGTAVRVTVEPLTPTTASAPGSGEVTAWGCEVDELVERIDRMTVEAGPGLDLRPHHQRMLIKEIWRLTEAVERARSEGEAKGRREALAWAYEQAYPRGDFGVTRADWDLGRTQYVVRGLAALAEGGGEHG